MTDAEERSNPNPPVEAPRNDGWIRFVGYVKRKRHERATKKKNETPTDARRTAVATIWMAIFTFVLAATSGLTIWVLKNQLREMHEGRIDTHALAVAAGKQADAAKSQADAAQQFSDTAKEINSRMSDAVDQLKAAADNAKRSIQATEKAMRLDQRAWVGPVRISPFELRPEEVIPTIFIIVRNSGKTPSMGMTSATAMQFVNPGQSFEPILNKAPTPAPVDIIQPNGELYLPVDLGTTRLNDAAINRLRSGESTLYVFGEITYSDVFGRAHFNRFCMFVAHDLKTLNSCATYNEAN